MLQSVKRETISGFKATYKKLVILFNMGVSVHFGDRKTRPRRAEF